MGEIYNNGPISCGIDASPILKYTSGIVSDEGEGIDHVISVVGWGEEEGKQYWIVATAGESTGARWAMCGWRRAIMHCTWRSSVHGPLWSRGRTLATKCIAGRGVRIANRSPDH